MKLPDSMWFQQKKKKKAYPRYGEAEGEKNLPAIRAVQRRPGGAMEW